MKEILLLRNNFENYIIEETKDQVIYLIPGTKLEVIKTWLGENRSQAFRNLSKYNLTNNELEERDNYYNHMLIINEKEKEMIGGQRFRINYKLEENINDKSYLEVSHPGIHKKLLSTNNSFVEVGRTFIMPKYQKRSWLKELIRGFVRIPEALDIELAVGMISFNHNNLKKESVYMFLDYLENSNFMGKLKVDTPKSVEHLLYKKTKRKFELNNLRELEKLIVQNDENFKIPDVLIPYRLYCDIKYENFSFAKNYNRILQLLFSGRAKDLNTKACNRLKRYNKKINII